MLFKLRTESHSRCFVCRHKLLFASYNCLPFTRLTLLQWSASSAKMRPSKLSEMLSLITQFLGTFIIIPVSCVLRPLERWDADAYWCHRNVMGRMPVTMRLGNKMGGDKSPLPRFWFVTQDGILIIFLFQSIHSEFEDKICRDHSWVAGVRRHHVVRNTFPCAGQDTPITVVRHSSMKVLKH